MMGEGGALPLACQCIRLCIRQLPFRFSEMARHRIRLWRMKGECGVFANSLKRIGKWKMANAKTIVA